MRVRVDEGVRGLYDFVVHRSYTVMQRMEAVEESGHVIKTCPEVNLTGPACCSLVVLAVALVVLSPMSAVRTNANRAAARKKNFSPYARVV